MSLLLAVVIEVVPFSAITIFFVVTCVTSSPAVTARLSALISSSAIASVSLTVTSAADTASEPKLLAVWSSVTSCAVVPFLAVMSVSPLTTIFSVVAELSCATAPFAVSARESAATSPSVSPAVLSSLTVAAPPATASLRKVLMPSSLTILPEPAAMSAVPPAAIVIFLVLEACETSPAPATVRLFAVMSSRTRLLSAVSLSVTETLAPLALNVANSLFALETSMSLPDEPSAVNSAVPVETIFCPGTCEMAPFFAVTVRFFAVTSSSVMELASTRATLAEAAAASTLTLPVKSLLTLFAVTSPVVAVNVAFWVFTTPVALTPVVDLRATLPLMSAVATSPAVSLPVRIFVPVAEASTAPFLASSVMESAVMPSVPTAVSVPSEFASSTAFGLSWIPPAVAST